MRAMSEQQIRVASPLRARLELACRQSRLSMGNLSALSERRDPYRLDTPAMHRDGKWAAEQTEALS